MKALARISVVVGLFALVTLSFRACHSIPVATDHPVYSLVAQYRDGSWAVAHADPGPGACCTAPREDKDAYPVGVSYAPFGVDHRK